MANRNGSLKMNVIDLRDILNESLKTMPDALPVEVVVDGNVVEIHRVEMYNGSLCLFLKTEEESECDVCNVADWCTLENSKVVCDQHRQSEMIGCGECAVFGNCVGIGCEMNRGKGDYT
jgi:hypothetical protein